MRRVLTLTAVLLMLTLMAAGTGMAAKGVGPGDGTGPVHEVLAGTPFHIIGTVVNIIPGDGMEVATEAGNAKVYGIGPIRFWKEAEIDRPVVGDTVDVSGFTVNYNNVERSIAMSIMVEGQTLQLRDPATGLPLWKGTRTKR